MACPFSSRTFLGLDVSVDHPTAVRMLEGIGYLVGDPRGVLDRELLLAV